jgi:hypothetical protein
VTVASERNGTGGLVGPFASLESGERIRVRSRSGNTYEATVLAGGKGDAGLYVRLKDGRLARLSPDRLDVSSLERLGRGPTIVAGDRMMLLLRSGPRLTGTVATLAAGELSLRADGGIVMRVAFADVVEESPRLLFPASDLKRGDEIQVRSLSGHHYGGTVLGTAPGRITAILEGELAARGPTTLRVEQLDKDSLFVLVPIAAARLGGGEAPRT